VVKINSFSPFENFARWFWEFHDDNLIIKTRSFTLDFEREVKYEKIKIISNKRVADLGWFWASFIAIVLLTLIDLGLSYFCVTSPLIIIVEKFGVIFALALVIPAFRKHEYYFFLDANKNLLATIKIDNNSKPSILKAINLIKQKTELISETYFNDQLPDTPPVFQFTEFNLPDFLNKAQVGVYEDKIIDVEKSLAEELTTVVNYVELSGKTKFAKAGNEKWEIVWVNWLFFVSLVGLSASIFFSEQLKGNHLYFNLLIGGWVLLVPLFLLRYIKNEILLFYDKQDNAVFWTRVNPANREKLSQIIEFVKNRVA
jgi:hypothetical protein